MYMTLYAPGHSVICGPARRWSATGALPRRIYRLPPLPPTPPAFDDSMTWWAGGSARGLGSKASWAGCLTVLSGVKTELWALPED